MSLCNGRKVNWLVLVSAIETNTVQAIEGILAWECI